MGQSCPGRAILRVRVRPRPRVFQICASAPVRVPDFQNFASPRASASRNFRFLRVRVQKFQIFARLAWMVLLYTCMVLHVRFYMYIIKKFFRVRVPGSSRIWASARVRVRGRGRTRTDLLRGSASWTTLVWATFRNILYGIIPCSRRFSVGEIYELEFCSVEIYPDLQISIKEDFIGDLIGPKF